jgi:hypothetical protein
MKVDPGDVEAMKALRSLEVGAFLCSRGWISGEAVTGRATVWTVPVGGEEYEVLLSLDPSIRDFVVGAGGKFLQVTKVFHFAGRRGPIANLLPTFKVGRRALFARRILKKKLFGGKERC